MKRLFGGVAWSGLVLGIVVGAATVARAQDTYTWSGGNGSWATAGNWTPSGGPPAAGDTANFGGTAGTISLATGAGNTAETVNVTGSGAWTWGTGKLTIGAGNFNYGSSVGSTFSGTLAGNGGFRVTAGTLYLSNTANSYFGHTEIRGGTVYLTAVALGNSTVLMGNSASSAVLDFHVNTATLPNDITVQAGGVGSVTVHCNHYGPATFSGDIVLEKTASLGSHTAGSSIFTGDISGAGAFIALGTVTLSGNNSYQGGTTINSTPVYVKTSTALGSGTVTMIDVAGLYTAAAVTIPNTVTYGSPNNYTIGGSSAHESTFTGTVSANGHFYLTAASGGTVTFQNTISAAHGGGVKQKTGAGTVVLAGANSFAATFNITRGTVVARHNSALGTANAVQLGNGYDASLLIGGAYTINRPITVSSDGGTRTLGGNTAHNSEFSGNITLGKAATLTAAEGGTVTFSGTMGSANAITKTGLGKVVFSTAKAYTGATTVNQGALLANNALTSPVTVNNSGTFGGSGTVSKLVTVKSGGVLAPGADLGATGTLTLNTEGLTLEDGAILDLQVGTAKDLIRVTSGAVTGVSGGGKVSLRISDAGGYVPEQTYVLMDWTGASASEVDAGDFLFAVDSPLRSKVRVEGSQLLFAPHGGTLLLFR